MRHRKACPVVLVRYNHHEQMNEITRLIVEKEYNIFLIIPKLSSLSLSLDNVVEGILTDL